MEGRAGASACQYFFSIHFGWRPLHFMQYFAGGTLCEEGPKVASLARPRWTHATQRKIARALKFILSPALWSSDHMVSLPALIIQELVEPWNSLLLPLTTTTWCQCLTVMAHARVYLEFKIISHGSELDALPSKKQSQPTQPAGIIWPFMQNTPERKNIWTSNWKAVKCLQTI